MKRILPFTFLLFIPFFVSGQTSISATEQVRYEWMESSNDYVHQSKSKTVAKITIDEAQSSIELQLVDITYSYSIQLSQKWDNEKYCVYDVVGIDGDMWIIEVDYNKSQFSVSPPDDHPGSIKLTYQ